MQQYTIKDKEKKYRQVNELFNKNNKIKKLNIKASRLFENLKKRQG